MPRSHRVSLEGREVIRVAALHGPESATPDPEQLELPGSIVGVEHNLS